MACDVSPVAMFFLKILQLLNGYTVCSGDYNTESSVSNTSLRSSVLILIINSMQQWWGIFHKEMFCQKQIYHSSIIYPPMQYRPFISTDFNIFRLSSHCCGFQEPNKLLIWTADHLKLCLSISHWYRSWKRYLCCIDHECIACTGHWCDGELVNLRKQM